MADQEHPEFLTVMQFAKTYQYPSKNALRKFIVRAAENKFPVRRLGRRVLLKPVEVFAWLDKHATLATK